METTAQNATKRNKTRQTRRRTCGQEHDAHDDVGDADRGADPLCELDHEKGQDAHTDDRPNKGHVALPLLAYGYVVWLYVCAKRS